MQHKNEQGQAMVEFALVLPVLLLLLCGILDFGWIFSNQLTANNACREATRYTAIHYNDSPTDDDRSIAEAIVLNYSPALPSPTVAISYPDSESVKITVTSTVPILTGLTSTILGKSTMTITAMNVMKIE